MSPAAAQPRRRGRHTKLTMIRQPEHVEARRPPLRGICLIVKENQFAHRPKPAGPVGMMAKFPRRPGSGVVSGSIPLFFIARNRAGLWVAREADGRAGGIFLFKRSAVRFAERSSGPRGCATMFLAKHFELDVENRGNQLIGWIGAVLNVVGRCIPEYPPPIPMLQKKQKGEWQ
jgi:hypothetical protein